MKKIVVYLSIFTNILLLVLLAVVIKQVGGLSYVKSNLNDIFGEESGATYETSEYLRKTHLFNSLDLSTEDTVFLGDSLTAGVEWSELLEEDRLFNRGISGDTSTGVLNRLEPIIDANPKRIFMMIGVNDLYNDSTGEELLANYDKIINKIQTDSPDTEIFVQSILPINEEKYTYSSRLKNDAIINANSDLQLLSKKYEVEFIDLYGEFLMGNNLNESYTVDGLHLNGDGYLKWKSLLSPYLK